VSADARSGPDPSPGRPGTPAAADRLPFVDALRGFALFGVFGANLFIFSGFTFLKPQQQAVVSASGVDDLIYALELIFVENKFLGLFSLLFGVSFWLFLSRARARAGGPSPTVLFYRRIAWLFVIGAAHGWLLWCFDVLRFYALWALLLPLFALLSARRLLASALSAAVLVPALIDGLRGLLPTSGQPGPDWDALALAAFSGAPYPQVLAANWAYDWHLTLSLSQLAYQVAILGRLLVGLYLARTLDLGNLAALRPWLARTLLGGALVGVAGNTVFAGSFWSNAHQGFAAPFARSLLVEAGFLGLSLAYASALALLSLQPPFARAVAVLGAPGRMALSLYLLQTLFGLWLFYGFAPGPRLMGTKGPGWIAAVWVCGYGIQVALAHAWMWRFRFGPAEWLWRSLTYAKRQPFRRAPCPRP
jgi:uncharacterized protein